MSDRLIKLILIALLISLSSLLYHSKADSHQPDDKEKYDLANEIANFHSWTKVNPEPIRISSKVAMLCAPPRFEWTDPAKHSIHRRNYITVYVNETGRAAMAAEVPKFPVGSIIVKEKLNLPEQSPLDQPLD